MEREAIFKKKKISTRLLPKRPSRSEPICKNSRKGKESSYLFAKGLCKGGKTAHPYIELLLKPPTVIPTFLRLKSGKKNYLDFADLEHLTLKLLAVRENRKDDSHSLRKTVSDRFRGGSC